MKFPKINKIMNTKIQNKNNQVVQNVEQATGLNHIPKIEELVLSAHDYNSFFDVFENLEKQEIGSFVNPTVFKLNDIYVYLGFDRDADYYKNLFTELNNAQVSLAPKFIKSVTSDAGFSATFTQIGDTYSENLKDFNKFYNSVSKEEKENAYANIQKLLKLGIINNKILARNAFEVTPNTHKIVVSDWDSVSHVSNKDDKLQFLNVARETIFRK